MIHMRFKKGDRVRVLKISNEIDIHNILPSYLINKIGTIASIDPDYKYPYEVDFDDKVAQESDNCLWSEEELDFEISDNYNPYSEAIKWFEEKTGYKFNDLLEKEDVRKEFIEKAMMI